MPTREIITFVPEGHRQLLAALRDINREMGRANQGADEFSREAQTANRSLNQTDRTVGRTSEKLKKSGTGLKSVAGGMAKIAGVISGSLVASIVAFTKATQEFKKGAVELLQISSGGSGFRKFIADLNKIGGDLTSMQQKAQLFRQAGGLGLGTEDMAKLFRIGSVLGTASGRGAFQGVEQLIDALQKGDPSEELSKVAPRLRLVLKMELERSKNLTLLQKRQKILNVLLREMGKEGSEAGRIMNNPFAKLLQTIQKLEDTFTGLFQILKGVGLVIAGVLAPLAAGVGAGFMAAGPLGAAIGGIAGAVITSALALIGVKLFKKDGDQTGLDRLITLLTDFFTILQQLFGAFFNVLNGKGGKMEFPLDTFNRFGESGVRGLSDFVLGLADFFGKTEEKVSRFGGGFSKGFAGTLELGKPITDMLKSEFKQYGENLKELFSSKALSAIMEKLGMKTPGGAGEVAGAGLAGIVLGLEIMGIALLKVGNIIVGRMIKFKDAIDEMILFVGKIMSGVFEEFKLKMTSLVNIIIDLINAIKPGADIPRVQLGQNRSSIPGDAASFAAWDRADAADILSGIPDVGQLKSQIMPVPVAATTSDLANKKQNAVISYLDEKAFSNGILRELNEIKMEMRQINARGGLNQ